LIIYHYLSSITSRLRTTYIHGDYNHLIAEMRKDAQLFKK